MSVVFEAVIKELKTQRDAMADRAARHAGEIAKLRAECEDLQKRLHAATQALEQAQKEAAW
jgi:hypothetical protein